MMKILGLYDGGCNDNDPQLRHLPTNDSEELVLACIVPAVIACF